MFFTSDGFLESVDFVGDFALRLTEAGRVLQKSVGVFFRLAHNFFHRFLYPIKWRLDLAQAHLGFNIFVLAVIELPKTLRPGSHRCDPPGAQFA